MNTLNHLVDQTGEPLPPDMVRIKRLHEPCFHCGFEPAPEHRAESLIDMMKGVRRSALLEAVLAREGKDFRGQRQLFSSHLVMCALQRHG